MVQRYGAAGVKAWMNGPVRLPWDAIRPGDVIEWRTWCGSTRALVEWVGRDGTCGLMARDGYSQFHERMPAGACRVTEAEALEFSSSVRRRPVAYE